MNTGTSPETARCKCQYCNEEIEFPVSMDGLETNCPGCGMTTSLFVRDRVVKGAIESKVQRIAPIPNEADAMQLDQFMIQVRELSAYTWQRKSISRASRIFLLLIWGAFTLILFRTYMEVTSPVGERIAVREEAFREAYMVAYAFVIFLTCCGVHLIVSLAQRGLLTALDAVDLLALQNRDRLQRESTR